MLRGSAGVGGRACACPPPRQAGEKRAGILLAARKHNRDPEEIWRKCVCVAQGKRLCGVCVLHRRWRRAGEALFPEFVYDDTLAFFKLGAAVGKYDFLQQMLEIKR